MSSAAADIIARLVFQNNVDALRDLLKRWKQDDTSENFISSVDEWDLRGKIRRFQRLITGNPPLHLALMLGYKEVVNVLLDFGASCNSLSKSNWTGLDEAVCLGDRELLERIIPMSWREHIDDMMRANGPWDQWSRNMPSFSTELDVKLKSKIPVIAKACPREKIVIEKSLSGMSIAWSVAKIKGLKLIKAKMELKMSINDKAREVTIYVLNHDEKTKEQIHPHPSKTIIHDAIDSYLISGVIVDEMPIAQYEISAADPSLFSSKRISMFIKQNKFGTDIFQLSNLGWKQRIRVPMVEAFLYADCTDQCRNVGIKEHIAHCKNQQSNDDKIWNMEALQAISDSDLVAESALESEQASMNTSKYHSGTGGGKDKLEKLMLQDEEDMDAEEVELANRVLSGRLEKLFTTKKQRERFSTLRSMRLKTTLSNPSAPLEVRMHVQSFPKPRNSVSESEYFDHSDNGHLNPVSIGRNSGVDVCTFKRSRTVQLYMAKNNVPSISEFWPILKYLAEKVSDAEDVNAFKEKLPAGFPVRVDIPIMPMLKARITMNNWQQSNSSLNLSIPEDYVDGEIFPLIESESTR